MGSGSLSLILKPIHHFRSPAKADHLPLDQNFVKRICRRSIGRVFRAKLNLVFPAEEPLDRGLFLLDQCNDDLAVFRILAGVHK